MALRLKWQLWKSKVSHADCRLFPPRRQVCVKVLNVFVRRLCALTCVSMRGGVRGNIVSFHWIWRCGMQRCGARSQPIRRSPCARFMNEMACMRGTHMQLEWEYSTVQWCNTITQSGRGAWSKRNMSRVRTIWCVALSIFKKGQSEISWELIVKVKSSYKCVYPVCVRIYI